MTMITWDTSTKGSSVTFTNGDLTATVPNQTNNVRASEGKSEGKWYWEISFNALNSNHNARVGIVNSSASLTSNLSSASTSRSYASVNGNKHPTISVYGDTYWHTDTVSVALDLDVGTIEFYKNGVSQGIAFTDIKSMGMVYPSVSGGSSAVGTIAIANFGATPFKYPIPQGFKSYQFIPPLNKTLILHNDEYKNWASDVTIKLNKDINYDGEGSILYSNIDKKSKVITPSFNGKFLFRENGELKRYLEAVEAQYSAQDVTSQLVNANVTASSSNGNNTPNLAINNDLNDFNGWLSNSTTNQWLQYRFTTSKTISRYRIAVNGQGVGIKAAPKDWRFEASNDGTNWDILDTQSNVTDWVNSVYKTYDIQNDKIKDYTHYRIFILNNNGNTSFIKITEMRLDERVLITPEQEAEWEVLSNNIASKQLFEQYGMLNLSKISDKELALLPTDSIELLSFVDDEGVDKKIKVTLDYKWNIASTTAPTVNQFVDDGMDSLSPLLDRKVMNLNPQEMTLDYTFVGSGKVYRKKVDLNKYFDLRTIITETRNS